MAGKQVHHHAIVARVEVLHDDEGHAGGRRKRVQKLPAGVKAAGRGADRDDRKIRPTARGERPLKPTRSIRPGSMRMTSRHSAFFLDEHRSNGQETITKFWRDYDPFKSRRRLREFGTKARGMSNFRIFPSRETSIIVASASPWPKVSQRWEILHHERIDERGSGSRGASRGSRRAEA